MLNDPTITSMRHPAVSIASLHQLLVRFSASRDFPRLGRYGGDVPLGLQPRLKSPHANVHSTVNAPGGRARTAK